MATSMMSSEQPRYPQIKRFYRLDRTIGKGTFAKVKLAYHVLTGEKVAIKIMNKKAIKDNVRVQMEISAMKELWHQHVCKLYQVLETDKHCYMVMEYCSEGELFDYIVSREKLNEHEARKFFRQIVSAVAYLHNNGYAHRDLKTENLLLDEDLNLKLIDFGLCAKPEGGMNTPLSMFCGTPVYAAPELLYREEYLGSQVDIWSLGVLLYALLCGYLPFQDKMVNQLYRKIRRGKYEVPNWVSKESAQLLDCMLQTNPDHRITITQLLDHPWLKKDVQVPVDWTSKYKKTLDEECIAEMAACFQVTHANMETSLSEWNYDYLTATYLSLLEKKMRGQPAQLLYRRSDSRKTSDPQDDNVAQEPDSPLMKTPGSSPVEQSPEQSPDTLVTGVKNLKLTPTGDKPGQHSPDICEEISGSSPTLQSSGQHPILVKQQELTPSDDEPSQDVASRKERRQRDQVRERLDFGEREGRKMCSKEKMEVEGQKGATEGKDDFAVPQSLLPKQAKIPALEAPTALKEDAPLEKDVDSTQQSGMLETSPVIKKKQHQFGFLDDTSSVSSPKTTMTASALSPSRSYDSQLNTLAAKSASPLKDSQKKFSGSVDTLLFKLHISTPGSCDKICKSESSILSGLERLMDKVTPKKQRPSCEGLRKVKALHNVFRTTESNPDHVLDVLKRTMDRMHFHYKQKGSYTLRCTLMDDKKRARLAFDLEVCGMPKSTYLGVCRKRVKGDTWHYKQLCKNIVLSSKLCRDR